MVWSPFPNGMVSWENGSSRQPFLAYMSLHQSVACIFQNEAVWLYEVRENVVPGTMPSNPPFNVVTFAAQSTCTGHQGVQIRHFKRNVIHRRSVTLGQRHGVVVFRAADEFHRFCFVAQFEAQDVHEEGGDPVNVGGIKDDV